MVDYEDRLDELIVNFDIESGILSSPKDLLMGLAATLDSETAFVAMPGDSNSFDIPYTYTENKHMEGIKAIERVNILSEVIDRNEAITINEEEDIDDELRRLGVRSMLAIPFSLPEEIGTIAVCNKKTPSKFGALYISYDVKICTTIAFLLSKGLQLFESPFELTVRKLGNLQSEVSELNGTMWKISETVRTLARSGHGGIVMTDFVRERDAYLRMELDLLKRYPGQFAGIYQGELVAVSPDKMEVMEMIRKKAGNVRAFVCKITEMRPHIKLPASRGMQNSLM